MKLAEFKEKVKGSTQVMITHHPINGSAWTSERMVTSITAKGIHSQLSWEPHSPSFIDWPSPRYADHRIEGNSLTWVSKSGRTLFTYHFPLSVEEALAEIQVAATTVTPAPE